MTAGINVSMILTYIRSSARQLSFKCQIKDDLSVSTLSLKNGLPCIETQTVWLDEKILPKEHFCTHPQYIKENSYMGSKFGCHPL